LYSPKRLSLPFWSKFLSHELRRHFSDIFSIFGLFFFKNICIALPTATAFATSRLGSARSGVDPRTARTVAHGRALASAGVYAEQSSLLRASSSRRLVAGDPRREWGQAGAVVASARGRPDGDGSERQDPEPEHAATPLGTGRWHQLHTPQGSADGRRVGNTTFGLGSARSALDDMGGDLDHLLLAQRRRAAGHDAGAGTIGTGTRGGGGGGGGGLGEDPGAAYDDVADAAGVPAGDRRRHAGVARANVAHTWEFLDSRRIADELASVLTSLIADPSDLAPVDPFPHLIARARRMAVRSGAALLGPAEVAARCAARGLVPVPGAPLGLLFFAGPSAAMNVAAAAAVRPTAMPHVLAFACSDAGAALSRLM
jgi:hypothetical protein